MATYFVRKTGDDGNSGLTPAAAKLTLNAVEDLPVVPGDSVYIGAGTYRELLTCDVSGTALLPISYIGDYSGIYTGDAGVVRVTGSDDDLVYSRDYCVYASSKAFRSFQGFNFDLSRYGNIYITAGNDFTVDECFFGDSIYSGVHINLPADSGTFAIKNCYFGYGSRTYVGGIAIVHTSTVTRDIDIDNCIFNSSYGITTSKTGGLTIRNSTFLCGSRGLQVVTALDASHTIVVNNCILHAGTGTALDGKAVTEIIEDYNTIYHTITPRTNTNTGAHSVTYPPLFDPRWFFEAVK